MPDPQSQSKETDEKRIVNPQNLFQMLWEHRDFEVKNQWQRSVFLTTYLTLCFAGYGTLLVSMTSGQPNLHALFAMNGAAVVISMMGVVLSLLWICMAKGSSFWLKEQEERIQQFVEKLSASQEGMDDDLKPFARGNVLCGPSEENSFSICSPRCARFSPSKINVLIGIASLFFFMFVGVFHGVRCITVSFGCSVWNLFGNNRIWMAIRSFAPLMSFAAICGMAIWKIPSSTKGGAK